MTASDSDTQLVALVDREAIADGVAKAVVELVDGWRAGQHWLQDSNDEMAAELDCIQVMCVEAMRDDDRFSSHKGAPNLVMQIIDAWHEDRDGDS